MSYTLFSDPIRTARKVHCCIWCGQDILPGEKYRDERSVYDGNIQRHRWHPECAESSSEYFKFSGEEEFDPHQNERPVTAANPPKPANHAKKGEKSS